MNVQKVGNALDKLLGLDPGTPGAPEKIWEVVSERFRELKQINEYQLEDFVYLTFESTHQCGGNKPAAFVETQYISNSDWSLEEVKKDCAALARLGFNILEGHAG